MASTSSSSSSFLVSSHAKDRPNMESIRAVVASINQHINEFLRDSKTRKSAKLKCISKLNIREKEFFEFSEHSILSNLYWGIESIEAAVQSKCGEEKLLRLKNSEQMLQVPALLDENGVTAGIPNRYLVSSSYFYLCLVRKLQGDEWQVALHFLQAVFVSPRVVWTQFVPKLCEILFVSCIDSERREMGGRSSKYKVSVDFDEGEMGEKIVDMARRYKAWLTYYQVMSYGELPKRSSGCGDIASADHNSQFSRNRKATGTESLNLQEYENSLLSYSNVSLDSLSSFRSSVLVTDCIQKINPFKQMQFEKVHPLDSQEYATPKMSEKCKLYDIVELQNPTEAPTDLDQINSESAARTSSTCLQDLLTESQSDNPISENSCNSSSSDEDDFEVYTGDTGTSKKTLAKADIPWLQISDQKEVAPCSTMGLEFAKSQPLAPGNLAHEEANEVYTTNSYRERCYRSFSTFELSILELRQIDSFTPSKSHEEEGPDQRKLHQHDLQTIDNLKSTSPKTYHFTQMGQKRSFERSKQNQYSPRKPTIVCLHPQNGSEIELLGILEKAISTLSFSEGLGRFDEDYTMEIVRTYEMLSNKRGVKHTLVKDIILDQLLTAISASKEVGVVRASVSILSTLASVNKGFIQDINKNGLQLCNLASALKRNVHEAAVLLYLINPPPAEIKTLELLPSLVEVVSTSKRYKGGLASLLPTPPVASLMIIEVLVTSFDYGTNNMHLAAINSPRVLSGLLDAPRNNNMEDFTSLATILVKCMRFDGQCRKYISKSAPVGPFVSLLRSNQERAKFIALEFFHEILCMPRSSATDILQQIRKEGSVKNTMQILALFIQQSAREYKLLAANLLLQLGILENSPGKSTYGEEAVEALLEPLTSGENSNTQQLSAFLLSNLGGTYAWTGEPYTVAWLLKKTGLTSQHHRNMIRNFNWLDQTLQDSSTDTWCRKIARSIIKTGDPVFHALEKGLNSEIKKVSRECLTTTAWVGCGIARTPDNLRHTACEILLTAVEQFLHPGLELEERLLACLCIYNYAAGKGLQKLIHFSEGVRESLRRLSNITWMAEELLRVANFFLPNKWRISCVHTQILEANQNYSGAVTALIFYKGQLCSGYGDGSIKVWDMKGHTATLLQDMTEHKKAVTCFSLFGPGDCMLSGSADKTIRIWQMVRRKLECIEVIGMKESIQSLDTSGQLIFTVTQSHELKVIDSSRKVRDLYKSKPVKCVRVIQGKVYVGCMDSSIQKLAIANNQQREIKAPSKIWMIQSRPVNSISVYKDWIYSASAVVDGSNIKEWRRQSKPQMSLLPDRGTNVLAMEVVEDFIYLNCSSSTSVLQIWLRGTQQKVGRLSAGSKITSLLAGNDIVLCGTERGLIKGWIPL